MAIRSALELLEGFRSSSSPAAYSNEHKGSPFYVMGYAAFASHDYPGASLFFDAAVAEDVKKFGPTADKPALFFMRLEDKDQEVLASQVIQEIIATANELVDDYNARLGAQPISFAELRTHFLRPIISSLVNHKRTLITAFISFIAEWKYRALLIDLIQHGSREPFFLHIFRGCLLFESILKENPLRSIPPGTATLGTALQLMFKELRIPANLTIKPSSFDNEVQNLTAAMPTTAAIQMTGKIRNTLAHSLAWPSTSLDQQKYNLLIKNIAAACIHAISTLYR